MVEDLLRCSLVLAATAALAAVTAAAAAFPLAPAQAASSPNYDITTLAGKVASLHGTAGLQIRFSAFVEEQAADPGLSSAPAAPISPTFVPGSPLDGSSVLAPAV